VLKPNTWKDINNILTFIVILIIMIDTAKRNIETKIDWNDLDRCWAEQYEEDYGNLFSKSCFSLI